MGGYCNALGCLKALALFLSFFLVIHQSSLAMGERESDPACLASDTLRVNIGGEQFSFPRTMVRSIRGADVKHVKYDQPTASGNDACQKAADPAWSVDEIALDIKPENCTDDVDCYTRTIFAKIESLDLYKQRMAKWSGLESVYPNTPEELLEKCTQPKKPLNDWHEEYWYACDYVFVSDGLHFQIKFTGGGDVYPPEDIDNTMKLVRQEINKYKKVP